jgi:hypothetical protein
LANLLSAIRRRVLTPDPSTTKPENRGFHIKDTSSRELLETVSATFLRGYRFAVGAGRPGDTVAALDAVPVRFRGCAYEGAAMGFAIRDCLPGGRGNNIAAFLAGPAGPHIHMAYLGVGWAMARLPKFRWKRLHAPDPLLRWLVLDGYGFHQAYFHTHRYVHEQYSEPAFDWPLDGPRWYAYRAIDQGIGRAIWFVGGADVRRVAGLLDRFDPQRQPDLYSGAALAATYSGGADEAELGWFWDHAGAHQRHVAQGSALAACARARAGLVVPHNEVATRLFCGMTVAQAWAIADEATPQDGIAGYPAYEVWRQRIGERVVALRRD